MLNKYFLLLVGLIAFIYTPTIDAYGKCACSCCIGAGCDPRPVGTADAPDCDEFSCINACKRQYSRECDDPMTSEVSVTCEEVTTTTVSTTSSSTSTTETSTAVTSTTTTQTTTPPTPWPTSTPTNVSSTTTIITTTTTAMSTTTSTSIPQTTSSTTTSIPTPTTTSVPISTTTGTTKPMTTTPNGADFLRQSSSLMTSLIASIFLIINVIV